MNKTLTYSERHATRSNMEIWHEIKDLYFTKISDMESVKKSLTELGLVEIEQANAEEYTLGLWYFEKYDADVLISELNDETIGFEIFTEHDKI